jgi:hypothetical protein
MFIVHISQPVQKRRYTTQEIQYLSNNCIVRFQISDAILLDAKTARTTWGETKSIVEKSNSKNK